MRAHGCANLVETDSNRRTGNPYRAMWPVEKCRPAAVGYWPVDWTHDGDGGCGDCANQNSHQRHLDVWRNWVSAKIGRYSSKPIRCCLRRRRSIESVMKPTVRFHPVLLHHGLKWLATRSKIIIKTNQNKTTCNKRETIFIFRSWEGKKSFIIFLTLGRAMTRHSSTSI